MPLNKNQIRRIQTLIKMMRQNRYPNYTSFLEEMRHLDIAGTYDVSAKTLSRDIADLRDEYGAPIKYDSSRKGYYLTNRDWYHDELMIEPFEMKAALLGERIANVFLPDPFRGDLEKAIGALLMKNENGMDKDVDLDSFQVLCPSNLPAAAPEIFLTAYNAWEQHRYLKIVYRTSKNRVSEKFFEPHIFAWNGGCWYLKGKLHRDNEKRYDDPLLQVLALHRIEKAEMSEGIFYPEPSILKGVKRQGLFDFEKIEEVDVSFFSPSDTVIAERYAAYIVSRTPDCVRVRIPGLLEYEALQLILCSEGNAQVHGPDKLRKKLYDIAQKMLKNFREE